MMSLKSQAQKLWCTADKTSKHLPAMDYIAQLQHDLSPLERLNQITEHGMCIGCGLCDSLSDSISVELVDSGFERPVVRLPEQLQHETIDQVISTCPGTKLAGLAEQHHDQHTKLDDVWGAWQELFYSYSAEPPIRHLGSTGGVLTALGLYLVESGTVDFVLHAKASSANPSFGEATISHTRNDIINAAGSRYGPTATLKNVISVLEQAETNNQQFAFIGTPCDVSALRNLSLIDSRVDQHCAYMLTMVCGGFMAPSSLRTFIEAQGISFSQISSLRYRGFGCPGPTTITMQDGSVHEFTYLEFWGDDESSWGLPPRCKICPDGIGDAADIAVADTWEGGSPSIVDLQGDLGQNAVIARSSRGMQLMLDAIEAGYLARGESLTPGDLSRFQPHQETKKRAAAARLDGLESAQQLRPNCSGLRLNTLRQQASKHDTQREQRGAQTRAEQGKFSEATPTAKSQSLS